MTNRNIARRTPRMKRTWALLDQSSQTVGAANLPIGQDLMVNLETNLDLKLHDVTISAIRMNIGLKIVGTQLEFATICMGVIVMGRDALAVGTTALPDPAEEHADWMAYRSITLGGPTGATSDETIMHNVELHSDSMRKIRENRQTLAFIISTQFNTLASVTFLISGRVLVLGI